MPKIVVFQPIAHGELPYTMCINEDMRGDQQLMLRLTLAIASGQCPKDIASKKPPMFSLCRWNSAAIRLQMMYVSEVNPSRELIVLLHFIQQVYVPMWYKIRCEWSWKKGARHHFALLDFAKKATKMCKSSKIIEVTQNTIINNGFLAHCESVLLAMITDDDAEVRRDGYARIMKIRQCRLIDGEPHTHTSPSIRKA